LDLIEPVGRPVRDRIGDAQPTGFGFEQPPGDLWFGQ
jgi:hypothetical protein